MPDEAFQRRLLRALGRAGVSKVRPEIRSSKGKPIRALQRSLRAVLVDDENLSLFIPYFWAVFVHDGRSRVPLGPRRSVFFVWFKDPRRDPRLNRGVTPQTAQEVRRLTPDQWEEVVALDAEARLSGQESPVVITRRINKATPASPFFSNEAGGGMFGFESQAHQIAELEFSDFALRTLKRHLVQGGLIPSGPGLRISPLREEIRVEL